MKKYGIAAACVFSVALCFAGSCPAEKNSVLKPALIRPGRAVFTETFDGEKLGSKWAVSKGEWTVADGVVTGREKAEEHHAAVLTCKVPNHNSAIQVSFQLGDAKFFHLSFNKKRGHLFRVMITPGQIVLRTDKPNRTSKSRPVTLARSKTKFQPGKWYTLLVEVRGNDVVVQTDNGVVLKGSHPSLDVDKPNYRFVTRGKDFRLDDVKIWMPKP